MIVGDFDSLRLVLHLLAAAVWVGGQIVLAGIVPVLRREAPTALPKVAGAFARLAWPAMLILVVTGAWSLAESDAASRDTEWVVTLAVKLLVVGLAISATIAHSQSRNRKIIALGGALSLFASLGALYLGVQLSHG